jgi:hypothetical protein
MAAPTNAAGVKKTLANPEPSTHGPSRRIKHVRLMSVIGGQSGPDLLNLSLAGVTDAVEKVLFHR